MKKVIISLFFLITSIAYSQTLPICDDGSFQQTLVGVTGGVAIPLGFPFETYSFSLYGGQIEPCGPMPWQIGQGIPFNSAQFQTGPWISGNYKTGVTTFGTGGQFHMWSTGIGVQEFVGCSVTLPCTIDGYFVSAEIDTWQQVDGSYVYIIKGSGKCAIKALGVHSNGAVPTLYDFQYIQTTINRKSQLSGDSLAFSYGSIFVNTNIQF